MNHKITQAFILAAGRGDRMGPITDSIPKPLVKIANRAMIDHIIEKLESIKSINKIVINAYYLADCLASHIEALNNPKIFLSRENTKLETGGGLLYALPFFDHNKPILMINGDVIWLEEKNRIPALQEMIDNFDQNKMDILLAIIRKEKFFGYEGKGDFNFNIKSGDLIKPKNHLQNGADYVFSGIQIIHPRIMQNCPTPPFSMNYFYKKAMKDDGILSKIKGIELSGQFFHIGTIAALEECQRFFKT